MPPRVAAVAPMREEAVLVCVRAASDVVNCLIGNPSITKLDADQRSEIAVRLGARAVDDGIVASRPFHF